MFGRREINRAGRIRDLGWYGNEARHNTGKLDMLRPGQSESIAISACRDKETMLMVPFKRAVAGTGELRAWRGDGDNNGAGIAAVQIDDFAVLRANRVTRGELVVGGGELQGDQRHQQENNQCGRAPRRREATNASSKLGFTAPHH